MTIKQTFFVALPGERIIDGLKVKIDSVEIHFTSSAFNAQLTLLQIMVESRLPNFNPVNNISQTKIKDTNRNQILIFKYIEWQSLRFEARSETKNEELQTHSSPLRLITRNGSCKIVLKKSLLDCSTISARLQLNFDDLLWILTDATVLNFIHLLNYITQLINKAPMNKKNIMESSPTRNPQMKKNSTLNVTDISRLFSQYDIVETSMHLIINRLQLHLSDDLNRSSFSSLQNGGGLHVILQKLLIDFYPYHKAIANRSHWLYYTDSIFKSTIDPFINEHLKSFFKMQTEETKNYSTLFTNSNGYSEIDKKLKDLLSFVILIRIGDYKINCVSTSESDGRNRDKKFSKEERVLISPGAIPKDLPAIMMEINQYYYLEPGSNRYSTRIKSPKPTLFTNIAPSLINFDIVTFLWVNAFYSSIHKSLLKFASTLPQAEADSDFHILTEIILPTFSINLKNLYNEDELPTNCYEVLEIKSTRISIKNSKGNFGDVDKLDGLFSNLRLSKLFNKTQEYPWIQDSNNEIDFNYNCEQLIANLKKEIDSCALGFNNQLLIVNFEPFWVDLKQTNQLNGALVEPFDLTLWMQINKNINQTTEPNLNVYCCFPDLKLHLDHFSYLFLIRLVEKIEYFSEILKSDFTRIQDNDKEIGIDLKPPLVLVQTVLPNVEVFVKLNTYETELIQSNISDKSSFQLSEVNVLDKDDYHNDTPSTDLVNDEQINQLNSQMNSFQLNNQLNSQMNNQSTNPFITDNPLDNSLVQPENVEETIETSSVNRVGDTFIGLFNSNSRNGYTSISSASMNTSLIEEDNRSIMSDLSIESEKLAILNFEDDTDSYFVFRSSDNEDGVEEGVEITEDTLVKYDSLKQPMQFDIRKKVSQVTYLKLTLRNISFLNQNKNFIATILATVHELEFDSHFKVPYDQFEKDCRSILALFKPVNYSNEPNLLVRIDTDTKTISSKNDKEMITAVLQNLNLKTLDKRFIDTLMIDFLLDEDAEDVSKVKVLLNNIQLKIKDEQLKTPVINLNLRKLLIDRNLNNEIQIGPFDLPNCNHLLLAHQSCFRRLGINLSDKLKHKSSDKIDEDYLRLLEENRQLKLKLNL